MAHWAAKAIVQKGISFLPGSQSINHWFQQYITKGVQLTDAHFADKYQHALDHVRFFQRYGKPGPDKVILELGSGWYPIVPLFFFLTGSGRVISMDVRDWMSAERQIAAMRHCLAWRDAGRLHEMEPFLLPNRWQVLEDITAGSKRYDKAAISKRIGLDTRIEDARSPSLTPASVDFFASNNTFEHIPFSVLKDILAAFKTLAKPGAVMSHFVDLSDHFAHSDPSISIYHFLRFSERQWRLIDNDIQPQNRQRWPAYLDLYKRLELPVTHTETRPGDVEALSRETLHEDFKRYPPKEAAISHGYLVSVLGSWSATNSRLA